MNNTYIRVCTAVADELQSRRDMKDTYHDVIHRIIFEETYHNESLKEKK